MTRYISPRLPTATKRANHHGGQLRFRWCMKTSLADPRKLYPVPPFPIRSQRPPGAEEKMRPIADHGEESYRGSGRLKGRRALITGGDSGIGRAVALAYAREGADVAVSYLDE